MATFVLVHGAWHGGWCWKKMTPLLRQAGHEVFTPTLTGLGERSHLLSASVDLSCHIQDVVNVIVYEDLHDVILVGHSYGGMVITGVIDRCRDRVAHAIYLDAFVPEDGQSTLDLLAVRSNVRERMETENAPPTSAPVFIPTDTPQDFGVTDPEDVAWMQTRLGPQSMATTTEPLRLQNPSHSAIPHTFVSCTQDQEAKMPSIARAAARIRLAPGWRYLELHTGHDAMITAPQDLAELLLQLV